MAYIFSMRVTCLLPAPQLNNPSSGGCRRLYVSPCSSMGLCGWGRRDTAPLVPGKTPQTSEEHMMGYSFYSLLGYTHICILTAHKSGFDFIFLTQNARESVLRMYLWLWFVQGDLHFQVYH